MFRILRQGLYPRLFGPKNVNSYLRGACNASLDDIGCPTTQAKVLKGPLSIFSSLGTNGQSLRFKSTKVSASKSSSQTKEPKSRKTSPSKLKLKQDGINNDDDMQEGLKYEKMTQREHVLLRPEPYVGALNRQREVNWVLKGSLTKPDSLSNQKTNTSYTQRTNSNPGLIYTEASVLDPDFFQGPLSIVEAETNVSPAFYKIFDEILVNASDNLYRESEKGMTYVKVTIDTKRSQFKIENDGAAIPIVIHPKENVYVPELIFGHLLTSSNFDDSQQRYTGGRHGFGAKMTNILSSNFKVTIVDGKRKLQYQQEWVDNMSKSSSAEVTKLSSESANRTTIEFQPDMKRFGMDTIDQTTLATLRRRVVDTAAALGSHGIKVYLNNQRVPISNWKEYLELVPALTSEDPALIDEDDEESDAEVANENTLIVKEKKARSKSRMVIAEVANGWTIGVGAKLEDDIPAPNSINSSNAHGSHQIGHLQMQGGSARQLSFVNGISTGKGGTHVTIVAEQVVRFVLRYLSDTRRRKRLGIPEDSEIPPSMVRSRLAIFVSALIPNPVFDSQVKDALVTPLSTANAAQVNAGLNAKQISGDKGVYLSEQILTKIVRDTQIVKQVASLLKSRAEREVQRKLSLQNKKNRTAGRRQHLAIEKLDDANLAGTARSSECTLILTEGDSAKALAIAGLSVVGRERFGVYPLKGKMLNVRDASLNQIQDNKELNEVAEILGLRFGVDYNIPENRKTLRYGSVMVMADQDHDGSHIKGLFLNIIATFWPGLLRSNEFVREFITPIVKAFPIASHSIDDSRSPMTTKNKKVSSGSKPVAFYTIPEYLQWKSNLPIDDRRKWRIKYYKGLGTSTAAEGREYFGNLPHHVIRFQHLNEEDDSALELAFSKKLADNRKAWLLAMDPNRVAMAKQGWLRVSEFIHFELSHFSMADTIRSIPSLVDGLKPGQRKVLFGCFKRNLIREVKVAQLSGYVSEHTGYHHGEASLHGTIINMTHDFPGSNNLPLLEGVGQFGTRHMGGKDAASPRYIFTKLHPITRKLFIADDDYVLKYRDDDGLPVEPYFYAPAIPIVLVNGAEGIGTGFSTSVPTFHPLDIIENVRRGLTRKPLKALRPWTWGFLGDVRKDSNNARWVTQGIIRKTSPKTLEISELPWGVWTSSYKATLTQMLEDAPTQPTNSTGASTKARSEAAAKLSKKLADRPFTIRHFTEHHTERTVCFRITMTEENMSKVESMGLLEAFKLHSYISSSNLHLFDENQRIQAFADPREVIDRYLPVRLEVVQARKEFLLDRLKTSKCRAENKLRFIEEVISGELIIAKKKKAVLIAELMARKYTPFGKAITTSSNDSLKKFGKVETAEVFTYEDAVGSSNLNESPDSELASIETSSSTSSVKAVVVKSDDEFDYLLNMPLYALTLERMNILKLELSTLEEQTVQLEKMTASDIWLRELEGIELHLNKMNIPQPSKDSK